jgi:hypothetical protein
VKRLQLLSAAEETANDGASRNDPDTQPSSARAQAPRCTERYVYSVHDITQRYVHFVHASRNRTEL